MKKALFFLALLAALAATACGSALPYAAKVDGTSITQHDLNLELEAIRDNKAYGDAVERQLSQQGERLRGAGKGTFDAGFVARVLTRQVYLTMVHNALEHRHIKLTKAELDNARKQQEEQFEQQFRDATVFSRFHTEYQDALVRRSAEVAKLQDALSNNKVDAAAVKAYYDTHPSEFAQTCVRHILAAFPGDPRQDPTPPPPDVEAEKKAQAQQWKDRIAKGEDFAAIAKAESGDPGSGPKGGDLGCEGGFVKEFTDAEDALQPGQVSDPVRTDFGYHIIEVTSRKQQSLEEATPAIEERLRGQSQSAVSDFLQSALKKAKVTVNPRYGTFSKGDAQSGQQAGIVPPPSPTTSTTAPQSSVPEPSPGQP